MVENQYDLLERPVQNDTQTLPVTINLALQQIIDFVRKIKYILLVSILLFEQDGKNEVIIVSGWMVLVCVLNDNT